jgi:predicted DNA binding protein
MYLDNNNHFYGKIGGKSINDFLKFDYNLKSCQERIDFVNEVLGMYEVDNVEFYDEYFDEVYDQDRKYGKINIVIGKDKSQYTESNIANALEIIANYILAVDEKEKSINYKIYTSEELFNKACKEYKLINSVAKANGGIELMNNTGENIVEGFPLYQLPKNFKKVKDLKIEKVDLEKYPPMKDYQNFYEYLKEESNRLWSTKGLSREELIRRGKIKKILPEIKKDMLEVKKQLQMPIIWKAPLKDSGEADYDMLDMFDKNVVKELLRVKKQVDLQDDLSCILVDLENLINKVEFTDRQKEVLNMWKNGVCIDDIAKDLKVRQNTISKTLSRAVESIIKKYEEEYENWYYLNIRKGTYKKCSKCGEIKLISQFDKNGKKGFKSMCKKCRK